MQPNKWKITAKITKVNECVCIWEKLDFVCTHPWKLQHKQLNLYSLTKKQKYFMQPAISHRISFDYLHRNILHPCFSSLFLLLSRPFLLSLSLSHTCGSILIKSCTTHPHNKQMFLFCDEVFQSDGTIDRNHHHHQTKMQAQWMSQLLLHLIRCDDLLIKQKIEWYSMCEYGFSWSAAAADDACIHALNRMHKNVRILWSILFECIGWKVALFGHGNNYCILNRETEWEKERETNPINW